MQNQSSESGTKKPGCFGRLIRGGFALACLAVVIGVGASLMGGDESTHTLHGHVGIMNSANFTTEGGTCHGVDAFAGVEGGATMTVTMRDEDAVEATLADGFITDEGNCQLDFMVEVVDGDWATFAVGSQSQDQRIVKDNTADAVPSADADDWWVSVQYDLNEN